MATFTTWTALLTSIRDALASRDLTVSEYTTPAGTTVRARTIDELVRLERFVAQRAAEETATPAAAIRRTHGVPSSGGNW